MLQVGSFRVAGPGEDGDIIIPPHPLLYPAWSRSTRVCVEALEAADVAGKIVLDLGTGTGILAVVLARLGAAQVIATEADPNALQIARQTFELNGVTVDLQERGDPPDVAADLCVANIGADYVRAMRQAIRAPRVITVDNDDGLVILDA